jgi:hypothetical protein
MARQVGDATSIFNNSIVVFFNIVHYFVTGEVFHFRSLSYIVDQKGILHHVVCAEEEAPKPRFIGMTEQKPVSQKRGRSPRLPRLDLKWSWQGPHQFTTWLHDICALIRRTELSLCRAEAH